jgi:hypothetical protein
MTRTVFAVILAAAAAAACDVQVSDKGVSVDIAEGKAADEWTRAYTLAKGGRLEIINTDGPIEAFPATGAQVEVRVQREVRSRSDEAARELLKQLAIREEVSPDRVKVEAPEMPQVRGFRQGYRFDYRVSVPPGLTVVLRTQNGPIRLENVDGQFTVNTTNGGINGRGVTGTLDATTVNGGITMELGPVSGDVRLNTVNGGIRLDVRPDLNASLDASAVNGGVIVHDGVPLSGGSRDRQRVTGRINAGGPTLLVQTTNGGVRIGVAGRQ